MRAIGMFLFASLVALLLRSTVLASLATRGIVIDVLVLATVTWSLRQSGQAIERASMRRF